MIGSHVSDKPISSKQHLEKYQIVDSCEGAIRKAGVATLASSSFLYDVVDEEEPEEEVPSELNVKHCGHFLEISKDKLGAKYVGSGHGNTHENDVGSVQANKPCPTQRSIYYYELVVKDDGKEGCIAIGFTDARFKLSRQPGWEPNSFGYRGDNGKIYHASERGDTYGPKFGKNDIVGAGINYASQEIFFTLNGKFLGVAFKEVKMDAFKGVLFPTLGLHSVNERVEVNFGQQPFLFDVEALLQEERDRRQQDVESISIPPHVSHRVVRSYLLYYGYQDTLAALDRASGGDENLLPKENGVVDPCSLSLGARKELRELIQDGKIDAAIAKLQELYPDVLKDDLSRVSFLLSCQKFLEMIKAGAVDEAVEFARNILSRFRGVSPAQDAHLQDCLALLAYEQPSDSPLGHLLGMNQREAVADAVNAAVLSRGNQVEGAVPPSPLEQLLRQLTACHMELRMAAGGQGEVFRLHSLLQKSSDLSW